MKELKNILVPTDFSSNAHKALLCAIQIAKATGANLCLMHAYRLILSERGTDKRNAHLYKAEKEENIRDKFQQLQRTVLADFPNRAICLSQIGFLEDVVESYLMNEKVDLIVMGTRGTSQVYPVFGRALSAVVAASIVPVLAVPERASDTCWQEVLEMEGLVPENGGAVSISANTHEPVCAGKVQKVSKHEYGVLAQQMNSKPAEGPASLLIIEPKPEKVKQHNL